VIALGADYDVGATPGLAETGNEFYSVPGAERVRELLPTFTSGRVVVGICGAPYKCPPAPSETVLLLHDYLSTRGVRDNCEITLVTPLGSPVPPSPDTSRVEPASPLVRRSGAAASNSPYRLDGLRRADRLTLSQVEPLEETNEAWLRVHPGERRMRA